MLCLIIRESTGSSSGLPGQYNAVLAHGRAVVTDPAASPGARTKIDLDRTAAMLPGSDRMAL